MATYTARVYCSNCEFHGEATFQCGNPITSNECPKCKCTGLVPAAVIEGESDDPPAEVDLVAAKSTEPSWWDKHKDNQSSGVSAAGGGFSSGDTGYAYDDD